MIRRPQRLQEAIGIDIDHKANIAFRFGRGTKPKAEVGLEVGFPGGSFTMDFDTAYLLASHKFGHERISGRVERFSTRNSVHVANDGAREDGHAWTVAWMHEANAHTRTGIEYVRVDGDRPGVATFFSPATFDPRTGGSTITIEYRYNF